MHPFDQRMHELERAQHGLVALRQISGDWTPETIRHRARARRALIRRMVLANPSVAPTFEQRVLAAVLAAGVTAFASHETAASLWKLPLPGPARLEITTSLDHRPIVSGVRMHRSGLIEPQDVRRRYAIPVASPELTIYGLSSRFGLPDLGRMVDDAVRRKILTLEGLEHVVRRLPRAPGRSRKKMRIVLDRRLPGVEDRESDLEDFVQAAIVRFELPPPVAQHPVVFNGQQRRIDLSYPDEWVALEAKGFEWYKQRTVFDRDALRGNELQLAGFRVLSFTSAFTDWHIACQIAAALELPAPPYRPPLTYAAWSRSR